MKLAARLTNENGKVITLAANEEIEISLTLGNQVIERLRFSPAIDNGYDLWLDDESAYLVRHYTAKGTRTG